MTSFIRNRFIPELLKNTDNMVSLAGVLSSKGSQVLLQLLLVRILSGNDYSHFYFYYSAITGLSMFIGDGIGLASSRFISGSKTLLPTIVDTAVFSGFFASLIAGLLVLLHATFLTNGETSGPLVGVLVLFSISISLSSVLQYVTISVGKRVFLAKTQLFFALLLIGSASVGASLYGWVGALLGSLLCVLLSNAVLLLKSFKFVGFFSVFKSQLHEIYSLLQSALPICGSMVLGGPIHVYCISILKKSTLDTPTEVGIFGISFVAYTLVSFLPGALGQFLVPWLLKNGQDNLQRAFSYVVRLYLAMGSFLLLAILTANWIGLESLIPSLAHSQRTIFILSVTGFIAGFIALYSFLLNALYKSTLVLYSTIYHSLSYVLFTYLLVGHFHLGAVGLASAILISSSGQFILLSFLKNHVLKSTKEAVMIPAKQSEWKTSLVGRYFIWHLALVSRIYGIFILKFDKQIFCRLFNIGAIVRRADVRFFYDASSEMYEATSARYKLYFFHKRQANMAYQKGIETRAKELGAVYFLPEINFKNGDVVVDCGANVGDLHLYFREKNLDVNYIGFEPSPLEYECLKKNVPRGEIHNAGLWHENGSLTFYVSSQGADSSFIKPVSYDDIKNIPTHRLDKIVKGPIKLLKLEAEGAEPEVLIGCEALLSQIEYISADLGYERGVEQTSTLAPATNFLLSRNFELVHVNHSRIAALFRNKSFA